MRNISKSRFAGTRFSRFRRGFTIVELMVSISIIGLLMAMLLPAVQSARESSRRVTCVNHLKQIGVAFAGFESARQEFPSGFGPDISPGPSNSEIGQSPLAQAIDWLGYPQYHALINDGFYSPLHHTYDPDGWPAWTRIPIPTFLCPSDQGLPGTNYVACTGSRPLAYAWSTFDHRGIFSNIPGLTAGDVTDGLSNTVAASERIQSDSATQSYSREQDIWGTGLDLIWINTNADEMVQICSSLTTQPPSYYPHAGWSWDNSEYGGGLYNHLAVPNSPVPDCASTTQQSPPQSSQLLWVNRFSQLGMSTARSRHPGGVNVLFLDGGVRFVSNSIDLQVWRGIGTIAGAEVVGDAF